MKTINNYILEKLKLSKTNKIITTEYNESILDIEINNFQQLTYTIEEYFKSSSKYKIKLKEPIVSKKQFSSPNSRMISIISTAYSYIDIKDFEKDFIIARLYIINCANDNYLQTWLPDDSNTNNPAIKVSEIMHPGYPFEFGKNFKDWITIIKKRDHKNKFKDITNLFFPEEN